MTEPLAALTIASGLLLLLAAADATHRILVRIARAYLRRHPR